MDGDARVVDDKHGHTGAVPSTDTQVDKHEHGACDLHREGSGGADGMPGEGMGVGDMSEMPGDAWGSGHTAGDDDGWGLGRESDTGMVGKHGRAEQDAWAEPSGERVGVSHSTSIEHGACEHHREGSGDANFEKHSPQDAEQRKKARQAAITEQPSEAELAADPFTTALTAVPAEDWHRTWPADRTIMLRMISKRVKEGVDKVRPPAVVRLSRSFWDDARNGTVAEKLGLVLTQLAAMPARCRIVTLQLSLCEIEGLEAERLAEVMAQCPALDHLDLSWNKIGVNGAGMRAGPIGMLAQCTALTHLNLSWNQFGPDGAGRLAGVLPQCPALAHLDLSYNRVGDDGAGRLTGVLAQCPALAHLNLRNNEIGADGAGRLAGVLPQCPALIHLELSFNLIRDDGAGSLAGVLPQCPALAHLALIGNGIGTVGSGQLRASWLGQVSGLLL